MTRKGQGKASVDGQTFDGASCKFSRLLRHSSVRITGDEYRLSREENIQMKRLRPCGKLTKAVGTTVALVSLIAAARGATVTRATHKTAHI